MKNATLILKSEMANNVAFTILNLLTDEKLGITDEKLDRIDVILQTSGGDINEAYKIVRILRKKATSIRVIIPLYAWSAGTLIAIGADEIILSPLSSLGPLDAQVREQVEGDGLRQESALDETKSLDYLQDHAMACFGFAADLIKANTELKLKDSLNLAMNFVKETAGVLYTSVDAKRISSKARALEVGYRYGEKVLRMRGVEEVSAQRIAKKLVYDYPVHSFILDPEELKDFKDLKITVLKDQELLDIVKLVHGDTPVISLKENLYDYQQEITEQPYAEEEE